ncbi:hypothetical protein PROFUN_14699, partial [Planoprotostelium fungivorum]
QSQQQQRHDPQLLWKKESESNKTLLPKGQQPKEVDCHAKENMSLITRGKSKEL